MLVLALVLPAFAAFADSNTLYIVGAKRSCPVAVVIKKQADCVAVPVTVDSETKEVSKKEQTNKQTTEHANRLIAKALVDAVVKIRTADENAAVKAKSRLDVEQIGLTEQPYLYLLMGLENDQRDMAYYSEEVLKAFKKVFFTGMSRCQLGAPVLAVRNVEQYRPQLIGLILEEVKEIEKVASAKAKITIGGLESPIIVRQVDDKNVEMYINYRLSIEMEK